MNYLSSKIFKQIQKKEEQNLSLLELTQNLLDSGFKWILYNYKIVQWKLYNGYAT